MFVPVRTYALRYLLPSPAFFAFVTFVAFVASIAAESARAQDDLPAVETGLASYYADKFTGRPMADGTPFDPESNHAASLTLPLGTWVRVTNVENGRTAIVQIRDRGPYIDGRIIDLSPRTARALNMIEQGLAEVEVVPLVDEPADNQLADAGAELQSGE